MVNPGAGVKKPPPRKKRGGGCPMGRQCQKTRLGAPQGLFKQAGADHPVPDADAASWTGLGADDPAKFAAVINATNQDVQGYRFATEMTRRQG